MLRVVISSLEYLAQVRRGEERRTRGVDGRGSERSSNNLTIRHLINDRYSISLPLAGMLACGAFVVLGGRVSLCAHGRVHDARIVHQDTPHEGDFLRMRVRWLGWFREVVGRRGGDEGESCFQRRGGCAYGVGCLRSR